MLPPARCLALGSSCFNACSWPGQPGQWQWQSWDAFESGKRQGHKPWTPTAYSMKRRHTRGYSPSIERREMRAAILSLGSSDETPAAVDDAEELSVGPSACQGPTLYCPLSAAHHFQGEGPSTKPLQTLCTTGSWASCNVASRWLPHHDRRQKRKNKKIDCSFGDQGGHSVRCCLMLPRSCRGNCRKTRNAACSTP